MLDPKEIQSIAQSAISHAKADRVEVFFHATDNSLTRFANNAIHQNVSERDQSITVRLALGTKVGVASTNRLNKEGIAEVVSRARGIAQVRPESPDLPPLKQPQPLPSPRSYYPRTASTTPRGRASKVLTLLKRVEERHFQSAGAYSTGCFQTAMATSAGLFAHHERSLARFVTVVMTDSSSGFAERLSMNADDLDPESIAQEAIEKASRGQNPTAVEPGEYEVVLEEYAVSDILDFLAYLSFGALAVQEGRSFMSGKLGQKVMGENISIWDDGLDTDGIPIPFDYEGTAKKRVDLIRNGVAITPCHDSVTAKKDGGISTGHAPPPGFETFGPMPMNLFLKPGDSSRETMLASVKRGLLVTRFWYTRVVQPLSLVVTGMTRDGTFLVENGEVSRPVKNLRFTQGYLEALNNVEMIGREAMNTQTFFSFNRVPMLKIGSWNFTGATEY